MEKEHGRMRMLERQRAERNERVLMRREERRILAIRREKRRKVREQRRREIAETKLMRAEEKEQRKRMRERARAIILALREQRKLSQRRSGSFERLSRRSVDTRARLPGSNRSAGQKFDGIVFPTRILSATFETSFASRPS